MRVTKSSGPEVTVAEYAYDALGRRIRKIDSIGSETTLYYYNNNWQVVTEADSAGDTARYFVYGNFIDELLMMHDCSADEDYYACQDHLYSNVALVGRNGTVVERYEYDAYGKPTIYNADFTQTYSDSQYGNSYMFTGRRLDTLDNSGLKLQYNRNRYYNSEMGRWLTRDPIGYPDGMNPYEYVMSNPINSIDALGLSQCSNNECRKSNCCKMGQTLYIKRCWLRDPKIEINFNSRGKKILSKMITAGKQLSKISGVIVGYFGQNTLSNMVLLSARPHWIEDEILVSFKCHKCHWKFDWSNFSRNKRKGNIQTPTGYSTKVVAHSYLKKDIDRALDEIWEEAWDEIDSRFHNRKGEHDGCLPFDIWIEGSGGNLNKEQK